MKTDPVEIFQTIRATIQPYATLGFNATINTETEYKLCSDKIKFDANEGNNLIFAEVFIKDNKVNCCLFDQRSPIAIPPHYSHYLALNTNGCFSFDSLNGQQIKELEEILSQGFKLYKINSWV